MSDAGTTRSRRRIRPYQHFGIAMVVLLVGGVGGWAATSEISGAVIAAGSIVVESNTKQLQHRAGGTVSEILARDGDAVEQGDVVLRLDATITNANLAIVKKRLIELRARKARLEAERDGADAIAYPSTLATQPRELVEPVTAGETKLFQLRRAARTGQKTQLRQRLAQIGEEIQGLEAEAKAKARETKLIHRELKGARELWREKLMPISKLTAMEREVARVEGEHGRLASSIARAKSRISETELQIIQIDRDMASEVARELSEIDAKIGEFVERLVAVKDQLANHEIRAPQSGIVHQSRVHTVGGVVNAGETMMLIVPRAERLIVEAKVAPRDIDQLSIGQSAVLRFSAFNQRTTPELTGQITRISADTTTDERTGAVFYTVRIKIPPEALRDRSNITLVPGMPVEVFVRTVERKVISYLVKPFTDQIYRAFREQ